MEIPTLPTDITLTYLAEGAANVVYRIERATSSDPSSIAANTADLQSITPADSTSTPPPSEVEPEEFPPFDTLDFRGKLLRLHKDVSWIPSYASLFTSYQTLIQPLFDPSQVTSLSLIHLTPTTITECNAALRASETPTSHPRRPCARTGLYISTSDPHGLLIEDMSADAGRGESMIEFKPKWLAQSPNAPRGSRRCRTCALRASRAVKAGVSKKASFCPLDLGRGDVEGETTGEAGQYIRASLLEKQGTSLASEDVEVLAVALTTHLCTSPILRRLRELQTRLDSTGVLAIKEDTQPSDEFLVATTLRDCTLFIKMARSEGGEVNITAKLGDLDLKEAATGKLAYWRGVEQELIDGGFYEGRDGQVMGCRLERDAAGG